MIVVLSDEEDSVDLGGRRIIKKKNAEKTPATKTGPDALKLISVSEPGFSLEWLI